ncbi:MAG: protein-glutamate O-methyltransferase CheR [Gammaproteobacteria bacterium]|nr:MAG: protein-glutamate O-methyltransferase CheR [Gammaproteobacteria bacterium]
MLAIPRQKSGREFHFTYPNFETVRKMLYQHTGISLNDGKQDLVYGRLTRRLRVLQLSSFDRYLSFLESEQGAPEMAHFINALTTNLTAFFREPHHFDFLASKALPEAMRKHGRDHRIRCWSAGCSTGEEPHSIAIVVREVMSSCVGWDIKILATDLDSNVVATARQGRYAGERIAGLSRSRANKWFHTMGEGENVQVDASLQKLITFKQLNLMHTWPMHGPFDLIFCRNVVIYFDKPTQRKLFDRFADYLADGGYLFLGHSESMHNLSDRFELIGQTMYRKVR